MPVAAKDYEKHREKMREKSRERASIGQEIGPLPEVVNPERKARCKDSTRLFLATYFPRRFKFAFAQCHDDAIAEMEAAEKEGGCLAVAEPRGTGKTTIAECVVLHALLYGFQPFAVLLQATKPLAAKSLRKIKRELEKNPLLLEDFPEVCYPIRRLERATGRAKGQKLNGLPTDIEWTAESVTLPTVEGSAASGSTLVVMGIEGAGRGLSKEMPDGSVIRPGLVLVDDAQTRESAKSPTQTTDRETIITDDIMGMVGPGEEMCLIILCTVMYVNDLSDRFLDGQKHPEFRSIRVKMIEQFPANMDLWREYVEIRRECRQAGDRRYTRATEMYAANQVEMDRGAVLSWPERKSKYDRTGLQTAMNLYFDKPRRFAAEYQNEPESDALASAKELHPAEITKKLSNVPHLEVPRECTRLASFVDCGGKVHWYVVLAADERFNCSVIDYGTFPRQNRSYFQGDDPRPSMADVPGWEKYAEPQRVFAGITALTADILGKSFTRAGTGEAIKVSRCLVDAGKWPDAVQLACRQSPHAAVLTPSKGYARTSQARPMSEWARKPGERAGLNWRLSSLGGAKGRQCVFDPDFWKSFVADRLLTPAGGAGCMTLFGETNKRADIAAHEMFADHLTAEYGTEEASRGGKFIKWRARPDRRDNHWFDCLVGACVALSVDGLVWADSPTMDAGPKKPRKKISIEELYAAANKGGET